MRFLLYPQRVRRSAKRLAPVVDGEQQRYSWGQQCSPTCGCVVRFEAVDHIDDGQQRTATSHLSYTAKRILMVPQSSNNNTLRPVLTAKGRPMLQACTCHSLHHLASLLVDHYSNHINPQQYSFNWKRRAAADLEFQSLRSSTAFCQAVLHTQGLDPITSRHCFDLVEEAWTALCKGYLPQPRSQTTIMTKTTMTTTATNDHDNDHDEYNPDSYDDEYSNHHNHYFSREYNDDDDNDEDRLGRHHLSSWRLRALPFFSLSRSFWHGNRDEESSSSSSTSSQGGGVVMSTLTMFDWNQQERQKQQQQQQQQQERLVVTSPADWQAYVDWQQQQQQQGQRPGQQQHPRHDQASSG